MVDLFVELARDDLARVEAILARLSSSSLKRMDDAEFRAMCESQAADLRRLLQSLID